MIWIKTKSNPERRAPMRKRNYTKQVGLILTEEIYNQLIEQSDKEEVTISEWIREAIQEKLKIHYFVDSEIQKEF
jgi:hypothetical protein